MKKILVICIVLMCTINANKIETVQAVSNIEIKLELPTPINEKTYDFENSTIHEIAGELFGVDPLVLEGIERLESGHYRSNIYLKRNNTHGAKCWNCEESNFKMFETPMASTFSLAKLLKENYIDKGLQTLEEIQTKYCPTSDGCSVSWVSDIENIMENIENEKYEHLPTYGVNKIEMEKIYEISRLNKL